MHFKRPVPAQLSTGEDDSYAWFLMEMVHDSGTCNVGSLCGEICTYVVAERCDVSHVRVRRFLICLTKLCTTE